MSELKFRKVWELVAWPCNVLAAVTIYALFDVTWREAWGGDFK